MSEDGVLARKKIRSVPNVIPGVVDGSVTTSFEPDGSVSFHVVIGGYGAEAAGCDQIEFILRPEDAEILGESLRGERVATRHDTGSLPCLVGVCLSLRGA